MSSSFKIKYAKHCFLINTCNSIKTYHSSINTWSNKKITVIASGKRQLGMIKASRL